jgi:hypothetical protein
MDDTTRRKRGTGLLLATAVMTAATVVTLTAAPAGAATSTIKATGATITRTDATAGTTLTVKATVARLDLWCSSNKLVVNKKATTIPCNKLLSVTTTGLTGNDTVEINATNFGSSLPKTTLAVKTGAGNDTINVRHNGTLTVYAGAGNDKIGAGLASGSHPVGETLLGEDGTDTLSNYGFITAPRVAYGWTATEIAQVKALRSNLRGGPGADRYVEDDLRWSDITLDASDVVTRKEGPATYSPERPTTTAAPWALDVAAGDPYLPNTLAFGTTTSLDVRCAATATDALTRINGLTVPEPCSLRPLEIQGTDRADTVTYDQKLRNGFGKYGLNVSVDLKGGDDVAAVRAPLGGVDISGGTGNDRLAVGIYNSAGNADASGGGGIRGDAGNDTLTNLGFLDPNPPVYVPENGPGSYDFAIALEGGAGADRLIGAATTIDSFWVEQADTVEDPGGPAYWNLAGTSGADTITATGREALGTVVDIGQGSLSKRFTLSPLTISLQIDALAGDDNLSLLDRSKHTAVSLDPGDGIDALTTRFIQPWGLTWSSDGRIITADQTGWQPVSWVAANLELKFNYPED